MEWASRFDATRARAWLMRLGCAALLLGFVGTAVGERPKNERPRDGRGLTPATVPNTFTFQVNRVIFILQDVGEIGSSGSSVAGGGFWKATTNQYVFSSGANVGAKLPNGTIVFANGGPFSELAPGSSRFPELGVYWDSKDPADRAAFPEVCTVDAARIERFPSLASFAGEPFPGFADQTVCLAVNDYLGGTCGECAGTRVGVTIVETIFAFGVPTVQDFVFVMIRLFNDSKFINATNSPGQPPGPYALSETVFSFAMDPDIGDAGDDQAAFLPDVQAAAFWDHDFTEAGFQGPVGIGGTGLVVLPVDPNTGAEIPLAEFSLFTNGAPRPDPNQKEVWYAIQRGDPRQIILEVDPRDVRWMVSTVPFTLQPDQFVEMGAAYFFAEIPGAPPADLRAEAYKNLQTGQINPDANRDPVFDNLRLLAQVAQASGSAGFLQPVPPPSPEFELLPGDRQITITWDATPVTAANPFARLVRAPFAAEDPQPTGIILAPGDLVFFNNRFQTAAEAGIAGQEVTNPIFNPDFVVFDFEGFRVYRSRTGLADDAELIAQFDLSNTFVGGEFCVEATPVLDSEGNFVTNVCTETAVLSGPPFIDPDTGLCFGGCANDPTDPGGQFGFNSALQFAVTDRGGQFPNPENGPGLINGIPVAYAVTSFSVNCGILLPVIPAGTATRPPAACLNLESGKVFKLGTPESQASSFVAAGVQFDALEADGSACDTDEAAFTIDPDTGHHVDMLDCSNAIVAEIVPTRPLSIPSGDFFFVIDRILPIPGAHRLANCPLSVCYELAFGTNRVFWHWEKAGGAPATEIRPQSGFTDQSFDFLHTGIDATSFEIDADPSDIGHDFDMRLTFNSSFSVIEDVAVNGKYIHLLELGGEHGTVPNGTGGGERRPHRINGTSLADIVVLGVVRNPFPVIPADAPASANSREYSHPAPYAPGAAAFELTWTVEGGTFSGTMRRLPGGEVVPRGGGAVGGDNTSTPAANTSGYNWGFVAPGTRATVLPALQAGRAGPIVNQINLAIGQAFGIYIPGHTAYFEGVRQLPANGDKWTFWTDSGSDRSPRPPCNGFTAGNGREPCAPIGPFSFDDHNDGGTRFTRAIKNVFPGARWKLSLTGGRNLLAEAELSKIQVVPNPFIAVNEITRGRGLQRILFTNLPPVATIRIYTISGNLVRTLEHTDGSGTEEYDVRTRFDLILASGNYYAHVTTPDGRTHLLRFAVIN